MAALPSKLSASRPRILLLFFLAFLFGALSCWVVLRSLPSTPAAPTGPVVKAEPVEVEDRLVLEPASFGELPGWGDDTLAEALPALRRSCGVLARLPAEKILGAGGGGEEPEIGVFGRAGDWHAVCARAGELGEFDVAAAREFFESAFIPWSVANNAEREGLFTGYYEPGLSGSRRRGGVFQVPLYRRPPELVHVDLGDFREDLAGRRLAGRVEGGSLRPYEDRAALDAGSLARRGLELVWVDDPVDAFFLHIQGSGRVDLAEGGSMRVGYAGQNGHPYLAIGRELVERGELALEEASMQSIRRWLGENPGEAPAVMEKNASYIFFRELGVKASEGPLGSQGVPLTPGRSLAVDRTHIPLGVPIWLDTTYPRLAGESPEAEAPLRRLLIAQDTGGAIRGPVRGDFFWGHGEKATELAGHMKQRGRMWVLLPSASKEP